MTTHPSHPDVGGVGADRGETLARNPYAAHYQQPEAADLDAGAPRLKSNELRRMNRRALLMLGCAVTLLLLVSYWMISSATSRKVSDRPREEKVTVAAAPPSLALPPAHPRKDDTIVPARQDALPPLPPPGPVGSVPSPTSPAYGVHEPTLLQRRISGSADGASGPLVAPATAEHRSGTGAAELPGPARKASARPLQHADTLMQRGTYIRCVLETRIVTDVPGYTSCLVTEPVYSFNGHRLLLPKGSKMLGSYSGGPTGRRVAVAWDRIITPAGIDVDMSSKPSPGIDGLGGAGLPGHYDAHWGSRIGAALLVSMLGDAFKYEAARHGPRSSSIAAAGVVVQEPFESNTARTLQNLADMAVRDAANRPPTVTINQGTVIYVYVARDVDFSGVVARS